MKKIKSYLSEHLSPKSIEYTVVLLLTAIGAAGCMGNTEVEAIFRLKQKQIVAPPKEHYLDALDRVYDPNDSIHNQSRIRQSTLDQVITSPFEEAYKNRNQDNQ